MFLTNNSQLRTETDALIISNLLRKGWIEIFAPSYNPQTQQIEFDSQTSQFIVVDIPEDSIKQQNFANAVSQGFLVQPENFILGLQESDRSSFSQMLSLVKEALRELFHDKYDLENTDKILKKIRDNKIIIKYNDVVKYNVFIRICNKQV